MIKILTEDSLDKEVFKIEDNKISLKALSSGSGSVSTEEAGRIANSAVESWFQLAGTGGGWYDALRERLWNDENRIEAVEEKISIMLGLATEVSHLRERLQELSSGSNDDLAMQVQELSSTIESLQATIRLLEQDINDLKHR